MKLKKTVSLALSAAMVLSVATATAFAVESTPSKTGTDADAGKTETTVSGSESADSMTVEVEATEASAAEEEKLKSEGVEGYLGTTTTETAASIVGTTKTNVTVSEIKEVKVTGYDANMETVTMAVPFAALPEAGTQVAVVVRVVTPDGTVVNMPVAGVVVEQTVVVNGVARKVRKVVFSLDTVTMVNVQAGTVYVAVVTAK